MTRLRTVCVTTAIVGVAALAVAARDHQGGASDSVEQSKIGTKPAATLVESFDGLGAGFVGPHGAYRGRNPSDNSLAVGPDHIVQTVNSRLAIFSKNGKKYERTGEVVYLSLIHI